MDTTERSYYARRVEQETASAEAAGCKASRIAHLGMARRYREMMTRPKPMPSEHRI